MIKIVIWYFLTYPACAKQSERIIQKWPFCESGFNQFQPESCWRMRSSQFAKIQTWGPCYKTFYIRNLQMFLKVRVFVHLKPLQPSLMFAGKAGAYPSKTLIRCSTLGKLLAFLINIILSWISPKWINTPAHYKY